MSSNPLIPQILDGGLAAIQLASHDGVQLRITHVALGDAGYQPDAGQTGLRNEIVRYPIADGQSQGPRQLHLTALASDQTEFWVREVAFILEGGQPLAIWSDPKQALAYKQAGLELLLAFDLALSGVPAGSVTVQSTGAGLSLALAEELATLGASQIGQMARSLNHGDQLREHRQRLDGMSGDISALRQRTSGMEVRYQQQLQRLEQQAQNQREQLELAASTAAALINLQNLYTKGVLK
ncbi:phage tail-collar fiber domain-containing protein [Chromobacterium piscinae]|uniref:phage tail-collar fiber domain-containing protein n=1 Tax=Chromobacterium piscinae TaxID=686831 RepID=UPI001E5F14D8|nr:phage tail protein [Chromobacterium piscinae]MCD4503640.1 phage tail protein [Chromobacterium piscinae]